MKKVLILGNASDRLQKSKEIKNWDGELWICNLSFREYLNFPKINIVGTVHDWVATEASRFKEENHLSYKILSNHKWNQDTEVFNDYRGYSTGSELIYEAIHSSFNEIWLCGFCFINDCHKDIYTENAYTGNFSSRWEALKQEFPNQKYKFL